MGITFQQYEVMTVMTEGLEICSGAHDHVRECDANLTSNGSYYATPEQIREGQRRFRVKQLKKFFEEKQMKQRIRNVFALDFPALRSSWLGFLQPSDLRPLSLNLEEILMIWALNQLHFLTLAICRASCGSKGFGHPTWLRMADLMG